MRVVSSLIILKSSNNYTMHKFKKKQKKERIVSVTATAKRYVNKTFDHNLLSKFLLRKAYEEELVTNITPCALCFNNLYTTFLNFCNCDR